MVSIHVQGNGERETRGEITKGGKVLAKELKRRIILTASAL